jgi:hypothetical protein
MTLKEELDRIIRRQRVYASFREGGTKSHKELGAVVDLLESMERSGEAIYFDPVITRSPGLHRPRHPGRVHRH